ncbi:MAG: hypothetical protein H8E90_04220 [Anaerolineales bacterium]|nr:hypothetical protein [Anaerolineales bacterium]
MEIGVADQKELVELAASKQRTALFAFGHKWQSLCERIAQVLYPSVLLDSNQETMLVDGKRPDIIIDDGSIKRDPAYDGILHANVFIDAKLSEVLPPKDIQKYMDHCDRLELWVLVQIHPTVPPTYAPLDAEVEIVPAVELQSRLVSQGHSDIAAKIDDLLEERRSLEERVLRAFERELKRHLRPG